MSGNLSGDGELFRRAAHQVETSRNRYYCGYLGGAFDLLDEGPEVVPQKSAS